MRRIYVLLLPLLLSSTVQPASAADREEIENRAWECVQMDLSTAPEDKPEAIAKNLRHPYYLNGSGNCPDVSDLLSHADFMDNDHNCQPNGVGCYYEWEGIPYAIPGCWMPDDDIQAQIDGGDALGGHWCHKLGDNCPDWGGCSWIVGLACSGLVSYAWGLSCSGTCTLEEESKTKLLASREDLKKGSALINCDPHGIGHTVLFTYWMDDQHVSFMMVEETGAYPVARARVASVSEFGSAYAPYDFKDVVDPQGSDGYLTVTTSADGQFTLTWRVEFARDARRYDFQWYSPDGGWVTFASAEYQAPTRYELEHVRVYEATLPGNEVNALTVPIFRVREVEWDADAVAYCPVSPRSSSRGR